MFQGRSHTGNGNRRNRNNHHHGYKNKPSTDDKTSSSLEPVDPDSVVIKQFRLYAAELDEKHDRYERIIKLCRDVTIESKRIIFLLHSIDKESKREATLREAKTRLDHMTKTLFKNIALELDGQDTYQYMRAYRGGLQEFIEAITFFQYLLDTSIEDWSYLENSLTYTIEKTNKDEDTSNTEPPKIVKTLVTPNEYILGLADLTGELMRKCINDLASGDIASCYHTCNFVRDVYKGFLGCVGLTSKEVSKKLYTLKQSLVKMENVCYAIKVRGSEMPKHMLADLASVANDDYPLEADEGYQAF